MKSKDLKKDVVKSIRVNSEVLDILESHFGSVQKFFDLMLEDRIGVELSYNKESDRFKYKLFTSSK